MWAMILMAVGTAVAGAGCYVAGDILQDDPIWRPQNPAGLVAAQFIGFGTFLAGMVGGFLLYGWSWLWAFFAIFLVGAGISVDALKATGRDTLPGIAMLAVFAGVAAQASAYFVG